MALDTFVEADILATCSAVGSEIAGEYQKGFECIECLKDILRYLKRDSENHSVLRYLGSIRLLQTDLLPLLKKYHNDSEIFDFTLRILVSLTNPALLLFKEDLPDDKICRNEYLQVVSFLQSYKKAFIDADVWKVLYEHLKDMLKIRELERSTDEKLIIERIIILARNVLHVPPDESVFKQTDDDLSIHDELLMSWHDSNICVLFLYMCANSEEHQYCLHLLEIVYLMLREHTAEVLANSNEIRTESEKQKDLGILLAAREREKKLRLQKMQTISRPRIDGVYCVKNVKSLSNNDLIVHKYISNLSGVSFDLNKNARRRPKNRVCAPDIDLTRQSTLNLRLFLKKFCLQFLQSYNKLIISVKRELLRKVSDEHDNTYYFWAVRYFMQFNRLYDFQPALVAETVSTQTFHHIQTEITNYQEMMLTDKKKQVFWAKRMQLGVSAYKELLETLRKLERSNDEGMRGYADDLINRIFYVIEYRELLLSLITHYDEVKFPLSYLAELVESIQLFLKMLEIYSKKHSEIIVQEKQRKVRKRKKKKPIADNELINEEELLQSQWDAVSSELSAGVIGNQDIPEVTPFDGASDMTFEEQKVEAVFKIRESIIANKPLEALGLLRAARDIWPEGNTFGAADIEPEFEINVLKEIHFSNLKKTDQAPVLETEDVSEEDEEMESLPAVAERQLDLEEVYKKYASHKVVLPCSLLLANYRNNKPETNMCLIKLLHRIAWNCKMHGLFFQSTIFLTFQKIFHDPDRNHDPVIKELYRFAKFIVQKFFLVAEKNKKIFVEFLFWKGPKEAYEIEEGYGAAEHKNKGWTEDDEEELKYLFEENKDICIEGQDVADIILASFNKNKTKPQIISALKRLGLIKSAKDLKPEKRTEWIESEIVDLQHLFEEYKNSTNIMGNIIEKLSIKRSRKAVVEKLLELNLIQDRKEVRKKSSKKKNARFGEAENEDSPDESDENSRNEDETNNDSEEDEINFFKNLKAELNSSLPESIHDDQQSNAVEDTAFKSKKPNKIWDEQEIMDLIKIFNENSDADNILEIIQNTLTVKRHNKDVIKKLLELGLIKDKNEVSKKEDVKTTKVKRFDITQFRKFEEVDKMSDDESSSNERFGETVKRKEKRRQNILSDDSSGEDISLNTTSTKVIQNDLPEISKKKRQSKIWDEQEIMDLIKIFNENSDADNILEIIQNTLTIKRRNKDVIKKLLELGLIKDKNEVSKKEDVKTTKVKRFDITQFRKFEEVDKMSDDESSSNERFGETVKRKEKRRQNILSDDSSEEDISLNNTSTKVIQNDLPEISKKKRQSKIWDEQEIMDLIKIFNENSDADNILEIIQNTLTIKRRNKDVIKKLLELGLIKDKNEVSKKKDVKTTKVKRFDITQFRKFEEVDKMSDDESSSNERFGETVKRKEKRRQNILSDDSSEEDISLNTTSTKVIQNDLPEISKKKRQSKIWDEQEVMELTSLFHVNKGSNNIMEDILNGLTVKRPKQSVIEKLLELKLIEDKKEVRKKRESKFKKQLNSLNQESLSDVEKSPNLKKISKKQSLVESSDDDIPLSETIGNNTNVSLIAKKNKVKNIWEEQEIMELTKLFHKNQGSDDIVNVLSNSLRVKRPKPAIIEKLLELGLIRDKKEVRKKRESNSKKDKSKISLNDSQLSVGIPKNTSVLDTADTLNDLLALKKNRRLRVLSDSSDDEANTEDHLLEDNGSKEIDSHYPQSQNYKRKIVSSDDSSDDDITKDVASDRDSIAKYSQLSEDKLKAVISTDNLRSQNYDRNISSANSIDGETAKSIASVQSHAIAEDPVLSEDGSKNTFDNMQPPSAKRKRVVISSDESDDDEAAKTNQSVDDTSKIERVTHIVSKPKKFRVLDDSDDST